MFELDHGIVGPEPLLQFLAGNQLPGPLQQHGQKFNGLPGQLDLQAMFEQFPDLGVEFEGAKAEAASGSLGVIHCRRLSCRREAGPERAASRTQ